MNKWTERLELLQLVEARRLMADLRERGMSLQQGPDCMSITVGPKTLLTDELRQAIKAHKPSILALLAVEKAAAK